MLKQNFINFNISYKKIFIYTRVSTNNQKNGLDYQIMMCEQYIKNIFKENNFEILNDYGSSYNNKKVLVNLNKLKKNLSDNSLILVSETSRLGRNIDDVFSFLKKVKTHNSHIISISENICFNKNRIMDKKFYKKVIDSEEESDLLSQRIINKNNFIRNQGGYVGGVPYGKKIIKIKKIPILVKNPNEVGVINDINKMFKNSGNYKNISDILNEKKILKRGKKWTINSIKYIIKKFHNNILSMKNASINKKH